MAGIQSSNSVTTGTIQIATGVAFDADIADTTDYHDTFNCVFKIKNSNLDKSKSLKTP
jgi:hypothetical protein